MTKVMWTLLFTIVGLGVVTCVAGNDCNAAHVSECYSALTHYEVLAFPLYGEDQVELDRTCRNINESFQCVYDYVNSCDGEKICDKNCTKMISTIDSFNQNTGLEILQEGLCNPVSVIRHTYLENYSCIENNANHYAACHNDSQLSQEYISTLTDEEEIIRARCCFFTWYLDCFTNITRETCNDNATFYVSFSLHLLVGHYHNHLCQNITTICTRPPLPHDYSIDMDKPDQTINDIDNSLDYAGKGHSMRTTVSIYHILLAFYCVILFKHIFIIK